ncbi:MAG: bifunctional aminoglycoside phosphotransferase/ATP-binding protein [Desulfuromonadia bacterium]
MDHDTIRLLLDPSAYPEPTGRVELHQTHVSYIFLTDSHAYKIKKSVNLGFLDFTTLEKRRFFCNEEVRLNRRLSPHVYLGVVPIIRRDRRVIVDGEGEPFEYAVKMVRLPAERMMDRLLEEGLVTRREMEQVAETIARFHQSAERGGRISLWGSVEAIAAHWRENFQQAQRFRGETIDPGGFDFLEGWVGRFLQRNQALIQRRIDGGYIRDCDGDLHAANICLTDPVSIFDCIEFTERFRFIDTAADLAFLLMDLDRHGRPDLKEILLRRYLSLTGDDGMLPLLTFYQAQRAFIRGKVESLASVDIGIPSDERARFRTSATRSFSLAIRYAVDGGEPVLIITTGQVGTGKSTVARWLSTRIPLVHLSSDRVRKEIYGLPPTARGAPIYTPEGTERTYDELLARTADTLRGGGSLIVDATFRKRPHRKRFRTLAAELGVRFIILEVVCDEGEVQRRLARRELDPDEPSDARIGEYRLLAPEFEPVSPEEGEIVTVDTTEGDGGLHQLLTLLGRGFEPRGTAHAPSPVHARQEPQHP